MRFVRVKSAPELLQKGEHVIDEPNFRDEVDACQKKKPRRPVMSINYLRELVQAIGDKYIGETFNALTAVNVSNFKGTPCENAEQAHATIVNLFKQHYPSMFDAYVEYGLKHRPNGTNLVYFLGPRNQVSSFIKMGFEEVLLKDLNKPKKTVGIPAITNEEAAAKNQETVV